MCTICCDGEIEDAEHLILRCKVAGEERKNLLEEMKKVDGDLQDKSEKEQLVAILDGAVRQTRVLHCFSYPCTTGSANGNKYKS